jgi:(p)ppGpp synthase/HD superfamily hydrolase
MGTNKDPEVAFWYASAKHAGQMYGQQPYAYHLKSAVQELRDHILPLPALRFYDHDVIVCATFLHDVIEDTGTTAIELEALFAPQVVELVQAVTDGPGKNRRERKAHVYEAIRQIGRAALAVKLADRLANSLAAGLAKGESDMLKMYRKEQPHFEDQLRPFNGTTVSLSGFGPAFAKVREYLGMEAPGEWLYK